MRILLLANSSFMLVNFRAGLIARLLKDGHELIAVAPRDSYSDRFVQWGVHFIDLPMNATGTSPLGELLLFTRVYHILRRERPDAVFGYTIKPNIYGALSARVNNVPFLPNVTGLGSVFDREGLVKTVVTQLYRLALRKCPRIFLQNPDDLALFIDNGLARDDQAFLLPGSGVDLSHFQATPLPGKGNRVTFLLVARMLREKGVEVFAQAAALLRAEYPNARFQLLGPIVEGKSASITRTEIDALIASGVVDYLGETQDVRPFIAASDCVVLPSFYREGTPRSLLEAGAMGRPIITTDMPGCRDVVSPGKSGYLVAPCDSLGLENAIRQFLSLPDDVRADMGSASRKWISERFDETIVIDAYRHALEEFGWVMSQNRQVHSS